MTNHSPLILDKWDENNAKDEYHILLWKFKIPTQKLHNKMPTSNGMEIKNEIKITKKKK